MSQLTNIRDLEDGTAVDQVLLVLDTEARQTRNGSDFMRAWHLSGRLWCTCGVPRVAACELLSEVVPPAA